LNNACALLARNVGIIGKERKEIVKMRATV
jgi:hypothetical protein